MKKALILEGIHAGDRFAHETNDCTVNALTNVTGLPYPTCHAYLKAAGRRDKRGFRTYAHFGQRRDALGFRFTYIDLWDLCHSRVSLARLARLYPKGDYLVCISRHALCMKNGTIIDSARSGSRSRVKSVWRVERIGSPATEPAPVVVAPAVASEAPAPARPTLKMRKLARGSFVAVLPFRVTRNGATRQVLGTLEIKYIKRANREPGELPWTWTLDIGTLGYPFWQTGGNYRQMNQIKALFASPDSTFRNWTFEPGKGWQV